MKRLHDERDRLVAQMEALRSQMEALRNQVVGIDRAIAVLDGTEFKAPDRPRDRTRNVKDTVLGLLASAGQPGLSVNQVLDGAQNKGVRLDRGTVSSLLSRLKRENILDMKDGQYFVRPPIQGAGNKPHAIPLN
jgi:hypothetical protein